MPGHMIHTSTVRPGHSPLVGDGDILTPITDTRITVGVIHTIIIHLITITLRITTIHHTIVMIPIILHTMDMVVITGMKKEDQPEQL